jgi:hypothetical protein
MSRQPIFTSVHLSTGIEPVHGVVHDHHMTLTFKPSDQVRATTPHGAPVSVRVVGMVSTSAVQAAVVEIVSGPIDASWVASGLPHVTISCAEGVRPVESISAILRAQSDGTIQPVDGPVIHGRIVAV